jgi:hypothetical protein
MRARCRAVAISASIVLSFAGGVGQAAAQTAAVEPEVQIGEARAIERTNASASAAQSHDAAGVAVAGIAIARPATVVTAAVTGDTTSNAPAIVVGSVGAVVLLAGVWQLLRRRRYDLLA